MSSFKIKDYLPLALSSYALTIWSLFYMLEVFERGSKLKNGIAITGFLLLLGISIVISIRLWRQYVKSQK